MNIGGKCRAWLLTNRTSVRMAFGLRMISMAGGALLSLFWTRLLLRAMGDSLYGQFLSFISVTRLGGLGDLGISGVVGLKGGQMLGRGDHAGLRKLLASARALFLVIALALVVLFTVLSPWLPGWLKFQGVPGSGSLPLLFFWGGVGVAVFVLSGYVQNLNYANGSVTWPILPTVVIGQMLAPLLHWLLARNGAVLWVQYTPYVVTTVLNSWLVWWMLRWPHPWLRELRPLSFDSSQWKMLAGASGWMYLCGIGSAIFHNTDRLVINAGFGPAVIPSYQANYKACELALILITSASFVSLPKITQWISSSLDADRKRLLVEVDKLNVFQVVLGFIAALVYLSVNDLFIRLWLGAEYQGPLAWQIAFACTLAVTTGSDAGISISTRCGDSGLKKAGIAIAAAGLLNLTLSIVSMKLGSITGVAVSTVISQSTLSIGLGYLACRHLNLSWLRWTLKSWIAPLTAVLAAGWLKTIFPNQTLQHIGSLLGCYTALLLLLAWVIGINMQMLRSEIANLRKMLRG